MVLVYKPVKLALNAIPAVSVRGMPLLCSDYINAICAGDWVALLRNKGEGWAPRYWGDLPSWTAEPLWKVNNSLISHLFPSSENVCCNDKSISSWSRCGDWKYKVEYKVDVIATQWSLQWVCIDFENVHHLHIRTYVGLDLLPVRLWTLMIVECSSGMQLWLLTRINENMGSPVMRIRKSAFSVVALIVHWGLKVILPLDIGWARGMS